MRYIVACLVLPALLAGCAKPGQAAVSAAPQTSSCSAPANQVCEGCSVTCQAGQKAMCEPGQLTSGDNPACWNLAKCECQ